MYRTYLFDSKCFSRRYLRIVPGKQPASLSARISRVEDAIKSGRITAAPQGPAPSGDDEILVSKLKDDSWALMAESKIISLLQERTDELCRRGVSLIVLLCTGMFSKELVASVPVIYPQKLLYSIVPILAGGRKLGIISPDPKQTEQNYERWQKVSDNIVVAALNPYDKSNAPDKAAQYLKENGAEVVVLDCMGFTIAIKEKMAELMGVPVILPRTLVARVVGEML